jgi:putative methionine-R-sulfoxide reductase with GAF domain
MIQNSNFNPRNLTIRYLVALGLVALLTIGGQLLLQAVFAQEATDARVVNLAGRQRMLSQNIAKNTYAYFDARDDAARAEVSSTLAALLETWTQSQRGLERGDAELGLPGNNSPEVQAQFDDLTPYFQAIVNAASCLAGTAEATVCTSQPRTYLEVVRSNEQRFLNGMNDIVFQYDQEASARVEQTRLLELGLLGATLLVLVVEALFVFRPATQRIVTTIRHLTQSQEQLQKALMEIQQRERDLQTVTDVTMQISTILDMGRVLQEVSDLAKERLGLYHSHVYLLSDDAKLLTLAAGAGAVGRQMVAEKRTIEFENPQSIVATAARTRKSVVVDDTKLSPTFLPHRLLPDTRSELAVPLIARGNVVGVLDVQSDKQNFFDTREQELIEVLAAQVAVAISNARLYTEAERTSRYERAIGRIERGMQGANSMEEIMQMTVRELGKALRVPYTAIELAPGADGTQKPSERG